MSADSFIGPTIDVRDEQWRVVATHPRTSKELINGPTDERSARLLLDVARTFDPDARIDRRFGPTDWSQVND